MVERQQYVATFRVEYDGEALRNGTMDVRRLAPALLAIGDLCEVANREMNGNRAAASIEVRAFHQGSFGVELSLGVHLLEQTRALLLGGGVHDAKEILETLGFFKAQIITGGAGVVGLVKWLRGRRIKKAVSLKNGTTKLIIEHNHTIDVSDRVYDLFTKPSVQRDLRDMVAPLNAPGIEEFRVRDHGHVTERIEQEDVPSFEALNPALDIPDEDPIAESTVDKAYKVVALSEDPRHVWRLTDGESSITVKVEDPSVYQLMAHGRLGVEPGFIIHVRINSKTYKIGKDLRTVNRLIKILSKSPPPQDTGAGLFMEGS